MARYDKYEPKVSGGRAVLGVDWLPADIDKAVAVGLNAAGLVVRGAGVTGLKGILILSQVRKAGEVVDLMVQGEIVDFDWVGKPRVANADAKPGTNYFAAADGTVSSATGGVYVGSTRNKAGRLVVNFDEHGGVL